MTALMNIARRVRDISAGVEPATAEAAAAVTREEMLRLFSDDLRPAPLQ